MATYTNRSKNSTTFTNRALNAGNNLTWNEAVFTWDEASNRTWNVPKTPYTNRSKNSTTFSNRTKN